MLHRSQTGAGRPGRMGVMSSQQAIPSLPLGGGVSIPAIGLGTFALRGRRGYQAMRTALDLGYRHLDTATMYRNEAEVGRAVADSGLPREDVFVTTKMLARAAGRERQRSEERRVGKEWRSRWAP